MERKGWGEIYMFHKSSETLKYYRHKFNNRFFERTTKFILIVIRNTCTLEVVSCLQVYILYLLPTTPFTLQNSLDHPTFLLPHLLNSNDYFLVDNSGPSSPSLSLSRPFDSLSPLLNPLVLEENLLFGKEKRSKLCFFSI